MPQLLIDRLREPWQQRRFRQTVLLAGIPLILLVGVLWMYDHAFIEISVTQGAAAGNTTYRLFNQTTQQTTTLNSTRPTMKRLVRRGSYEVSVQQAGKSYLSVVTTGAFLHKTPVPAALANENARVFVGDNPAHCLNYDGQLLVSFGCGDTFNNIRLHQPATETQPTYTRKGPGTATNLQTESIISLASGRLVLLHLNPESGGGVHMVYELRPDATLGTGHILSELNPAKIYAMEPYQTGFLIHDLAFSDVRYYSALGASPQRLTLPGPGKEFIAFASSVSRNGLAVLSTNQEDTDDTSKSPSEILNQVTIYTQGTGRQFTFPRQYGAAALCGSQKLCLLANKQLEVYDINGKEPRLLYRLLGVLSIADAGNGLLVTRDKQVLRFDTEHRNGFVSYSLEGYQSCGLQSAGSGYVACITNSRGKRAVVFVNQSPATDMIDIKIAELLKLPEIEDISVYGNHIFISPKLGPLVYQPDSHSYGPDDITVKKANAAINQAIDRVGINRQAYTIYNPYQ